MAPPFIFRVDEIRQDRSLRSRREGREWRPPRPVGSSRITRRGPWLYNSGVDGQHSSILDDPPGGTPNDWQHFRTVSLYHNGGTIWGVPYDASLYQVGNGSQDDQEEDDEDSDDESDSDTDEGANRTEDWSPLSFQNTRPNRNDLTSYATLGAEVHRLFFQRPDQLHWINQLLPDRYHSQYQNVTAGYGGLAGWVPILIGLIAYSVRPDQVTPTLRACITAPVWLTHAGQRGLGRTDQRGLVIRTYTYTRHPNSNAQSLRNFENGRVYT